GVTVFGISFLLLVGIALILKLRPTIVIDTPRALLAISFAAAALLAALIAIWWYRFPTPPSWPEMLTGIAAMAVFFVIATIAISAALLSFSIYELQRIPAIHQKPRGGPMTIAASILIALLFLPTLAVQDSRKAEAPIQVVTTPTVYSVTLIAVDGLTYELASERPSHLLGGLRLTPIDPMPGSSATERWASVGTGVPTALHGVRAIDGVRFRNGLHLLQSVSSADFVLRDLAGYVRLAAREPLPPTVRKRDYVWEILAGRSVPALSINWWTTDDLKIGALEEISQKPVFAAAGTPPASKEIEALRVDTVASENLISKPLRPMGRALATVYLPALDIILNRLTLDPATRVAASVRALDNLDRLIWKARETGGVTILIGLPGEGQRGRGVMAATIPMTSRPRSAFDVAPTLCALAGFPASEEMPGRSVMGYNSRIPTYGPRITPASPAKVNEEYYENLKSLGYIR
ncbi:MAG: hypothetical protein QOE68_752, partial [Thermoanaerobaculia bacterium]|nr:hypothetical protein [Thermoanaerobaculia bacterium]